MPTNTVQQLYQKAKQYLLGSDVDDYDLTALFVIEHVCSDTYINLLARDEPITKEKEAAVFLTLDACKNGLPLAYALGTAMFNGQMYAVQQGVLIPRPETEELVAIAAAVIDCDINSHPSIVECGVGSGVISLELAKQFPRRMFRGWDISHRAIETAQRNMASMGLDNVVFSQGDFFDGVPEWSSTDNVIIVSNPPYVAEDEYQGLDRRVLREPKEALVADKHGLSIIFQLLEVSIAHSAILLCEIGCNQRQRILESFPDTELLVIRDLTGHDRFLCYVPSQRGGIQRFANALGI